MDSINSEKSLDTKELKVNEYQTSVVTKVTEVNNATSIEPQIILRDDKLINEYYNEQINEVTVPASVIYTQTLNEQTGELGPINKTEVGTKTVTQKVIEKGNLDLKGNFDLDLAYEIFDIIDEYRISNGVKPMVRGTEADFIEASKVARVCFHLGNEHSPWNGFNSNLTIAFPEAQPTVNNWIYSPGHNTNLLYDWESSVMAVGVYEVEYGGLTAVFGSKIDHPEAQTDVLSWRWGQYGYEPYNPLYTR